MTLVTIDGITMNVDKLLWFRQNGNHAVCVQLEGCDPIFPRITIEEFTKIVDQICPIESSAQFLTEEV